ncbi:LysR family transcriptional regulator [Feifania hominis]|uniref:LysR family transcriptional regulator n=1 Tax=Feifania hominis TaxID=2763660 RepID=A0A926DDX5_9FIRM|nr:LysR family transcriptional regulator [Feifania hominis]MBC8536416.1 LysR family transcriptional regulator [Feifania hominis]
MDLYSMRYIIAVAEHENFSLAAQACHVGQPALSQQVAKAESELGVQLFSRGSRGVTLTQAGQEFVRRAREIIQQADALHAEMAKFSGVQKGSLNLGIITSLQCIDFGGMLSAFCSTYPNISVNIVQGGTHQLIERLVDRSLDVSIMNRPVNHLPSQLHFQKLGEDRYSLAIPIPHRLAARTSVSLSELREEHFIFHQSNQVASELCLQACRRAGFEPNIVCRSSSPTTSLYMVQGGLGVALLPSEEFRHRSITGVRELKIREPIVKEVGISWRRDAASPLIDAAVSFSQQWTR